MPRRLSVAHLLALLLGAGCAKAAGHDGDAGTVAGTPDTRLHGTLSLGMAARLLVPGQSAELLVTLAGADGKALAGVPVLFAAPRRGVTGSFRGAPVETPGLLEVISGADGTARATLVGSSSSGVYLVEAWASDFMHQTFAISQLPGVAPAADPAEVRRGLEGALRAGLAAGALIHGPLYLPRGASIAPYVTTRAATTLPSASWFFYVDAAPDTLFAHDVRYAWASAEAGVPAALAATSTASWEPVLSLPGLAPALLAPPLRSYSTPAADMHGVPIGRRGDGLGPPLKCGIVVYGPPDSWLMTDAVKMSALLTEKLGVTSLDAMTDNSASLDDLEQRILAAKRKGCTKVVLVILAHGTVHGWDHGQIQLRVPTASGKEAVVPSLSIEWSAVAKLVKTNLAGTEICLFTNSCHGGSAIRQFQSDGLTGAVITGASAHMTAKASETTGTHFISDVIECFANNKADINGSGTVTLKSAVAWATANGRPETQESGPTYTELSPTPLPYAVPDVVILGAGNHASLTLLRPSMATDDPIVVEGTFQPDDRAVADRPGFAPIDLAVGVPSVAVDLVGKRAGVTGYTVRYIGHRFIFEGKGTIRVVSIDPIAAAFDQGTFTTTYQVRIENPGAVALSLQWSGPNCGEWSPQDAMSTSATPVDAHMAWTHKHLPCPISTDHADVKIGFSVSSAGATSVSCSYQGAATGTGPSCAPAR